MDELGTHTVYSVQDKSVEIAQRQKKMAEDISAIIDTVQNLERQKRQFHHNRYERASIKARIMILEDAKKHPLRIKPIYHKSSAPQFKGHLTRHSYKVVENEGENYKIAGKETSVLTHQFDDMGILLRDPLDINKARYIPQNIKNIWIPYPVPPEEGMALKQRLDDFLKLSPEERRDYMEDISEIRFVTTQDCENSACDTALIGQRGLFAKKYLPANTILGIYAGVFLRNNIEFAALSQIFKPSDMSDYLFRTAEDYKWPKISAYGCGNRLTIANAASNYSGGLEIGLQEVAHRRTLTPVYAKTEECPFKEIQNKSECPDILFLVTSRDMKPQEQFLYDYGPVYWANNNK